MQHEKTRISMRNCLIGGTAVTSLLLLGLGSWAAMTDLASAVIASGYVAVETSAKKVQHPHGGVINEIYVRDGNEVSTGDVLVRLDDTVTRANLAVITKTIDELTARQARLKAEQDGAREIDFPGEVTARRGEPDIERLLREETHLFDVRRAARLGQEAQLKERIAQLREQLQGLADQVKAKQRQIELIGQELQGVRELWRKNLVQLTRVISLERESARLEGERGSLISYIAQTKGKITETELQILQIGQDFRTAVGKELADVRAKLVELTERRVAAEDQLKRIEIRAPQDGVVHQLAVHTVGGVIGAGELLMLIVPKADALTVEARIAPQNIDQLQVGQPAVLRFTAFDRRTTPELNGEVTMVSADIIQDQKSGAAFYTARIGLLPAETAQLNGLKLVPGMPVETFIKTGERTAISYLTKPLYDQLMRSWRER